MTETARTPSKPDMSSRTNALTVRVVALPHLSPLELSQWRDLEQRALDGNPFSSVAFVRAAVRQIPDTAAPVLIVIQSGERWFGAGVFDVVTATSPLLLPHLRSWACVHTFLDGLLLDRDNAPVVAQVFWRFLLSHQDAWHGVEFGTLALDAASTEVLHAAAEELGVESWTGSIRQRASLTPRLGGAERLVSSITVRRAKSLRKGWRELEKRGRPQFRILGANGQATVEELQDAAETLLRLESLGWKGEQQTALLKATGQADFFRELIAELAAYKRVFFTEVSLNGEVIGSVAHLVSGRQAFAFKLGWNPVYERGCPGFQLKARVVQHAQQELSHFDFIDSCASRGSFIEHVWQDRRLIGTRLYATSQPGRIALKITRGLSWAKSRLFKSK